MQSTIRPQLSAFPPEVLDLITRELDGESIVKIWMCGDSTLNNKLLHGGITTLEFYFGSQRMCLRTIPSFVRLLTQVETFSWILSTYDNNGPIYFRQLEVLPPTLRKLRLNRRLSIGDPLQDDNRIASTLSTKFPLLEEIEVQDLGIGPGTSLPETLTTLECESCHGDLPSSISSLIIHQVGTGVFSGLRNHHAHPNFMKSVETFLHNEQKSQNLTHFEYHRRVSVALSEEEHWARLPRSLTRLYLMVEVKMKPTFLIALPKGLIHLTLGFCEPRGAPWIFNPAFAACLPRELEYLHLFQKSSTLLMSMFADAVDRLPRTLTTLRASLVGDSAVEALPPTISTLECSSIGSAIFPKTLTSLTAGLSSLEDLPPLLCHLSLSISSLETLSGSSKLRELHRLTDLTLTEQSRHGKTISPFWPPSLTRFHIVIGEEELLESELDLLSGFDVEDQLSAQRWAEAIPRSITDLTWVGSVPAFQPQHLQLFPSTITRLNYVGVTSDTLQFVPRSVYNLEARILSAIRPIHFSFIPRKCEFVTFTGFVQTILPEHALLLPKRLGFIRLCGDAISDEAKQAFQKADIRVSFSVSHRNDILY